MMSMSFERAVEVMKKNAVKLLGIPGVIVFDPLEDGSIGLVVEDWASDAVFDALRGLEGFVPKARPIRLKPLEPLGPLTLVGELEGVPVKIRLVRSGPLSLSPKLSPEEEDALRMLALGVNEMALLRVPGVRFIRAIAGLLKRGTKFILRKVPKWAAIAGAYTAMDFGVEWLKNKVANGGEAASAAANGLVGTADAFWDVFKPIADAVHGAVNAVVNAGRTLVNTVQSAANTIGSALNNIKNALPKWRPPPEDREKILESIRRQEHVVRYEFPDIIGGITDAIGRFFHATSKPEGAPSKSPSEAHRDVKAVSDELTRRISALTGIPPRMLKDLNDLERLLPPSLKAMLLPQLNAVKGAVNNVKNATDRFTITVNAAGTNLTNAVNSAFANVQRKEDSAGSLTGAVDNFMNSFRTDLNTYSAKLRTLMDDALKEVGMK